MRRDIAVVAAVAPDPDSGLVAVVLGFADESVARAGHGFDVPRLVPVVLKLRPQGAHVTVHHVALDHEVGPPQGVEDLFTREDAAGVRGEEVEQSLLEGRQMKVVLVRADLSVEDVDLKVADAEQRDKLSGDAMRPADHRTRASHEVVGYERDADVIVGPALKRVELPAQIAPAGERDHANGAVAA